MQKLKKLKILFLPAWYPSETHPVSGIFIQEHAKAVSQYCNIRVLYVERADSPSGNFYQCEEKVEDGLETLRIKYQKSPIPKTTYFLYLWSIGKGFSSLLKQGWKPEIIHASVYSAGVPAVLLGKIYKIPVVITEHWSGFPCKSLKKLDIFKARFSMNRAKEILPVSKDLEKSIKAYGIRNKFEVVPNVVNTNIFYPPEKKEKREIKKILFVALLSPQKGLTYLVEALSIVKNKREDFQLDIVGDGFYKVQYEYMLKKVGLEKFVKFHGLKTKKEIAEFMRNSDFFVLPSLWENFGCVLIEAMACGLPVIASNVGGIPEIINKDNGILVPSKNVEALSEAIDYMLDNYQNYSSEKISQYAQENFSYEAVGKQLLDIYESLVIKK